MRLITWIFIIIISLHIYISLLIYFLSQCIACSASECVMCMRVCVSLIVVVLFTFTIFLVRLLCAYIKFDMVDVDALLLLLFCLFAIVVDVTTKAHSFVCLCRTLDYCGVDNPTSPVR